MGGGAIGLSRRAYYRSLSSDDLLIRMMGDDGVGLGGSFRSSAAEGGRAGIAATAAIRERKAKNFMLNTVSSMVLGRDKPREDDLPHVVEERDRLIPRRQIDRISSPKENSWPA